MSLVKHGDLVKPLERIDNRGMRVIGCLVHGDESGEPLSIAETAKLMGWTQRYIRALLKDPLFKAELASQTAAAKAALQPKAINRLDKLMDSDTETVVLQASRAILDEPKANGLQVNINNQLTNALGLSFKPGYVVRLPAGQALPNPPIIDE